MKRCPRALQHLSLHSKSLAVPLRSPQAPCNYRKGRSAVQTFRSYASVSAAELQFGQPVHETHPHLLKAGERKWHSISVMHSLNVLQSVTSGITALEYAQRRSKLAAKLPKNGIAVIAASDVKYRSGAVFYEFHQDSNFFYLTGMDNFQCRKNQNAEYPQASTNPRPLR